MLPPMQFDVAVPRFTQYPSEAMLPPLKQVKVPGLQQPPTGPWPPRQHLDPPGFGFIQKFQWNTKYVILPARQLDVSVAVEKSNAHRNAMVVPNKIKIFITS